MKRLLCFALAIITSFCFFAIEAYATSDVEDIFFTSNYCLPIESSNFEYVEFDDSFTSQYRYNSNGDCVYHYEIANRLSDGTMLYERNIYAVADGTAYAVNGGLILTEYSGEWTHIYSFSNTLINGNVFDERFNVGEDNQVSVTAGEIIGTFVFNEDEQYEDTMNTNEFFFASYYMDETWEWFSIFEDEDTGENLVDQVVSQFSEEDALNWEEARELLLQIADSVGFDENSIFKQISITVYSALINTLNDMWSLAISDIGSEPYINSAQSVIDTVVDLMIPVAFAFALVFWLIGIMNAITKENMDFYTKENGIKFIGSIILILGWIYQATWFCEQVLDLNNSIIQDVLQESKSSLLFESEDITFSLGLFLIYITVLLVVIVISFMISIKLILRQLQLIALICTSPIFFGCLVSDSTKAFFWKFVRTFIGVTIETTYMAVIYVVGMKYWNVNGAIYSGFDNRNCLSTMIIAIAIGVMLFKPPKCLKNIIGV